MTISLKALHEKREQLKAGLAQIFVVALSPRDSASVASRTATVHRMTPRDTAPPTR